MLQVKQRLAHEEEMKALQLHAQPSHAQSLQHWDFDAAQLSDTEQMLNVCKEFETKALEHLANSPAKAKSALPSLHLQAAEPPGPPKPLVVEIFRGTPRQAQQSSLGRVDEAQTPAHRQASATIVEPAQS